jgi:amino acid permease
MSAQTKKLFLAIATLAGTIIGVGMFGLPYLAARTSFPTILFYLVFLGLVTMAAQMIYGEIITKTATRHQLPGYAEIYLGKKWKNTAFGVEFLAIIGIVLAYIIVGGEFLYQLLNPILGGGIIFYTLIFFAAGAGLVYFGIKSIAKSELILFAILIGIIVFLLAFNFKSLNFLNLISINRQNFFLPYGPVLFALWGVTVIPEIVDIVDGKNRELQKTVIGSTILTVTIYTLFTLTIFGLSGVFTSADALSGLVSYLPRGVISLALFLGLITIFTSFISVAETGVRVLNQDWGWPRFWSWLVACFLPLLLYFLGFKNFINIIGLVGSVLLGFFGLILFSIYLKIKNRPAASSLNLPSWLIYLLMFILLLGVFTEFIYPKTF